MDPQDPPTGRLQRNSHLQILRCLAAGAVVLDHSMGSFGRGVTSGVAMDRLAIVLGNIGVMAFFVLSGFLMMRQSYGSFGSARNALAFACRRMVRIVPLYWIVTVAWYWTTRFWPLVHAKRQAMLALAFLPNIYNPWQYFPSFQPGWTLNMEMFFYGLFACCLLLPRAKGVPVLVGMLALLVAVGRLHVIPVTNVAGKVLFVYTSQMLLLFLAGVVMAVVEKRLLARVTLRLPVSPAFALALAVPVVYWLPWTVWSEAQTLCTYAVVIAVVLLCVVSRPTRDSRFGRALMALGDASYSTYLAHVWTLGWVLRGLQTSGRQPSLVMYCVVEMVAAQVIGLAVHRMVEMPITRGLQRLPVGAMWLHGRLLRPNLGVGPAVLQTR